jgi:hypothetical protein
VKTGEVIQGYEEVGIEMKIDAMTNALRQHAGDYDIGRLVSRMDPSTVRPVHSRNIKGGTRNRRR